MAKKKKRWVLKIFFILLIILLGISLYGRYQLKSFLSKERLVEEIERTFNCRAEIQHVRYQLFSWFPEAQLEGVSLGARDRFAEDQVPLNERSALENPLLTLKEAKVTINFRDFLGRQPGSLKLQVEDAHAQIDIEKDSSLRFLELFRESEKTSLAKKGDQSEKKQKSDTQQKEQKKYVELIGAIHLVNSTIAVLHKEKQIHTMLTELDIELDQQPKEDTTQDYWNTFTIKGLLAVDNQLKQKRYLHVYLDGTGSMHPFAEEGKLSPHVQADLSIKKDSRFSGIPTLRKVGAALNDLKRVSGIDLPEITEDQVIQKDAPVTFSFQNDRLELADAVYLEAEHFQLMLDPLGWIDIKENQHFFQAHALASADLSARVFHEVDVFIEKKMPRELREIYTVTEIREILLKKVTKEGRIALSFISKGKLSDPDVELSSLPNLGDIISEMLSDSLKKKGEDALLKGLESLLDKKS